MHNHIVDASSTLYHICMAHESVFNKENLPGLSQAQELLGDALLRFEIGLGRHKVLATLGGIGVFVALSSRTSGGNMAGGLAYFCDLSNVGATAHTTAQAAIPMVLEHAVNCCAPLVPTLMSAPSSTV